MADKPADRTLFVLNIPPYATKDSIKNIFSKAGNVENVIFSEPNLLLNNNIQAGFTNGYVVFEKPIHLVQAMKLNYLDSFSTCERPILCGIKKWAKEYNSDIYNVSELQKHVNKNMVAFDKQVEIVKKKEHENKETDGEGWTLVTKASRNQGIARKKSLENKIKEKIEQGKKKKELANFYTFQIRQSKMKHLANLRQKFEEDKRKVDTLKQARKFRPY